MTESALAAELLRQGIAAVKAGQKEEARRLLMQVVELDEHNEQGWLWLSGVVETIEDRRICLENVLTINPDNAHAQTGLAWIEQHAPAEPPAPAESEPPPVEEPASASAGAGRCPRCQAALPPAAQSCPQCGLPLLITCPACGQYADVENINCPHCGYTLGDFRQGAAYHLALAQAYQERGQRELALEALARAEAEKPDTPQLLEEIIRLYETADQPDRAIAAGERAVQIAPEEAALHARLGALYRQQGRMDQALHAFQKALALDDQNPTAMIGYARIKLEEEGATAEVMGLVEDLIEKQPTNAVGSLLLADLYLRQKRTAQARKFYEHACRLSSPDSEVGREALRKLTELQGGNAESPPKRAAIPSRAPTGARPGCLTVYAILLANSGFFALMGAIGIALMAGALQSQTAEFEALAPTSGMELTPVRLGTALWIGVALSLVSAVFSITIAIGLWRLKNWARLAVITLQSLGLLLGVLQTVMVVLSFRQMAAGVGYPGGFPIFSLVFLLAWFAVQGYILFWFIANRDIFA
ncbi:MAG TPA: tetratricopeptide repeat protein [Anaerolineae bacterium]|nr:tetratricopeptide repeat protein [Anaerolineae bacterium]